MVQWPFTLGVALALLVIGGLLGDLWARTRRRRARDPERTRRPHYLLGLNYLVSDQPGAAIRELSRAVREETDAVEAYLALGNLLRENGQTERAIDVHKSLLHRKDLSDWERLQVLFSLGLDFKKAGLIDRAERTFREVAQRDPDHLASLRCLQQIQEELGSWEEATRLERRIRRAEDGASSDRLPALECEWARSLESTEPATARERYEVALSLRPDYAPGHLGLARLDLAEGRVEAAVDHLERVIVAGPPWALAALEPLSRACRRRQDDGPLERACDAVLEREPRAWRAHLMRARVQMRREETEAAHRSLELALGERPGSLAVQRQLWELLRIEGQGMERFVELLDEALEDARLVDPFVCLRCRFKSAELLARCPHCQQWHTMAEERY